MIELRKTSKKEVRDYMLTGYACYLITQNGDTQKENIAFAQSYFAVQTRKQELIEERISYMERTEIRSRLKESEKLLSQNIYGRGAGDIRFGRIRSKGGGALFGVGGGIQHMILRIMDISDELYTKNKKHLLNLIFCATLIAGNRKISPRQKVNITVKALKFLRVFII
jgi:hypothetical protein